MASIDKLTDDIINFLSSVKLAVTLLIILAAASIAGTIIVQNQPAEKYIRLFGPELYTFLSYLDIFDMYNSWWFRLLMALLLLNLVVCSARRLPVTIKLARPLKVERITLDFMKKQSFKHEITMPGSVDENLSRARAVLAGGYSKPKESETDWGRLLWVEKGTYSRFGVYLIHLSLLIILAGALIGGIWGYSADLRLLDGQTADRAVGRRPSGRISLPFAIRLDRFVVKYYSTGQISEYRSEVTVIEGGREVLRADILVNHPLVYRGVRFYQSFIKPGPIESITLQARKLPDGAPIKITIRDDRPLSLPEGAGTVQVLEFSENYMNTGPAAKVMVRPKGGEAFTEWAFRKRPGFIPRPQRPFSVDLVDFRIKYFSGLQVNYDPGVWLIWLGCSTILIGFLIAFFFAHQKVFLGLIPLEGRTQIFLAGASHRNRGSFKIKFEKLAARIGRLAEDGDEYEYGK